MQEIWKDIEGYEGLYQVSSLGNIRSLARYFTNALNVKKYYKGKVLTTRTDKGGYKLIDLRNGHEKRTYKVHRLVAIAFIPNPKELPQVNHKKEFEKWNNCVDNLEWMTSKENLNYGTARERLIKTISKSVYQYDLDNNLIKIWNSSRECIHCGFNDAHVRDCCRGISKTHKGFKWSRTNLTTSNK